MTADHHCTQGMRILRLEQDAAAAEAERRRLSAYVAEKMLQVSQEIVGMGEAMREHLETLRADLDSRTRAAFARIDELRDLLGGQGHA